MLGASRNFTAAAIRLAGHGQNPTMTTMKKTAITIVGVTTAGGSNQNFLRVFSSTNQQQQQQQQQHEQTNRNGNKHFVYAAAAVGAAATVAAATTTTVTMMDQRRRIQPHYPQPDTMVPSPIEAPTTLPQKPTVNSPPKRPDLPVFSRDEVAEHCDEDSLWYTFRGYVCVCVCVCICYICFLFPGRDVCKLNSCFFSSHFIDGFTHASYATVACTT